MGREVFAVAAQCVEDGIACGLATLVSTTGGAPVPLGTSVNVDRDLHIAGSMGVGCGESEIVEAARATARDGQGRRIEIDLGGDGDPLSSVSGCGSLLEIAVWRPSAHDLPMLRALASGSTDTMLSIDYEREGETLSFRHLVAAKAPLLLVGGTSLAAEIAAFGRRLDFRTLVIDPRSAFATPARLPGADEIIVEWPDHCLPALLSARTPLVALSHDPKIDIPALRCALDSPAPYIALLGSRKSQANRRDMLRRDGVAERDLRRIRGPAGLDLGGKSLAETALSIVAEIVAAAHGRVGQALSELTCPIHEQGIAIARL